MALANVYVQVYGQLAQFFEEICKGHLAQIIVEKWQFFEDIVPSQHWLKQRMDEMEKSRNFIAHSRTLLPSEFQRMYMYIADWNRVIGL